MHGMHDDNPVVYSTCKHKNGKVVLQTSGGVNLCGSSATYARDFDVDYVIDLNGHYPLFPPAILAGSKKLLSKLVKFTAPPAKYPEVLRVQCPDYKAPLVSPLFWAELLGLFPKGATVLCTCMGGHGRTGTAMASLLAADTMTASEAIKEVRSSYCDSAIEAEEQEKYILQVYAQRLLAEGNSKEQTVKMVKEDLALFPKPKKKTYSTGTGFTQGGGVNGNNVKEFRWYSAYAPVCPSCGEKASVAPFGDSDNKSRKLYLYKCKKCGDQDLCYRDQIGVASVVKGGAGKL